MLATTQWPLERAANLTSLVWVCVLWLPESLMGLSALWTLFEIASQRSTSQAYWLTLALISNIANYLKYNYFWDCVGIDNVTLRLWRFSDFCSRHTEGVAGDDIMFHIPVLSVYVCHDVCPDNLTMKDWCHTKNILRVYCWGCLVVQVMFHVLLTSLMTSAGHKIGQI